MHLLAKEIWMLSKMHGTTIKKLRYVTLHYTSTTDIDLFLYPPTVFRFYMMLLTTKYVLFKLFKKTGHSSFILMHSSLQNITSIYYGYILMFRPLCGWSYMCRYGILRSWYCSPHRKVTLKRATGSLDWCGLFVVRIVSVKWLQSVLLDNSREYGSAENTGGTWNVCKPLI